MKRLAIIFLLAVAVSAVSSKGKKLELAPKPLNGVNPMMQQTKIQAPGAAPAAIQAGCTDSGGKFVSHDDPAYGACAADAHMQGSPAKQAVGVKIGK